MVLNDKHKKVALELAEGIKNYETIAEDNGITVRTLYNWRKDEDFQKYYKEQFDNLFLQASAKALKTIVNLMETAESENVRLNASKDILSRAGFDATAKQATEISTPTDIVISISEDE